MKSVLLTLFLLTSLVSASEGDQTLRVAQYELTPKARILFLDLDSQKQNRITETRTDYTAVFEARGMKEGCGRSVILDKSDWTITIVNNADQINLFEELLVRAIKNAKIIKSEQGHGPNSLTLVDH